MDDEQLGREPNLLEAKDIVTDLEKLISENSIHLDPRFKALAERQNHTDE